MGISSSKLNIKVYLAGPEVFHERAVEIGRRKKEICLHYGIDGLFPFDNEIINVEPGERIDDEIYKANIEMIIKADCAIVNLTPFRGPSADVGSVFELGFILGMQKFAFGYTNVTDKLSSRVERYKSILKSVDPTNFYDYQKMSIEKFDNNDNLMIDASLRLQGSPIISAPVAEDMLYEDLRAFEKCVRMVVINADSIKDKSRKFRQCTDSHEVASSVF